MSDQTKSDAVGSSSAACLYNISTVVGNEVISTREGVRFLDIHTQMWEECLDDAPIEKIQSVIKFLGDLQDKGQAIMVDVTTSDDVCVFVAYEV